jgi:catechol 2,3-dioxygenase
MHTDIAPIWPAVSFGPRRLGHVNLYVADLERSFAFYHDICGLELAFDEPGLFARFLSNGNSHHDVALMEASTKTLTGRDGKVQKSSDKGQQPGLNHLAFEMATEAELVAGIARTRDAGYPIESTYDHQISRSVYLPDPDGVSVELYADSTSDWRGLYQRLGDELLSAQWEPGGDGPPSDVPRFTVDPEHRPVAEAVARPLRTARAALSVSDLVSSVAFYERFIGLDRVDMAEGAEGWAVMSGQLGHPDLLLLQSGPGQPVGFHHFGLELEDQTELEDTRARADAAGVTIVRTVDHARKHGIVVRDPDGMAVEFYAPSRRTDPIGYAAVATPAVREFLT